MANSGHPGRLANKVCIVTGGSSSIGRAICVAYARQGARAIIVGDLQPVSADPIEAASPTHELVETLGAKGEFVKVDTRDAKNVDELVEGVVKRWGRLDVFVNNAGVSGVSNMQEPTPFWETSEASWDFTMSVNAKGVFNGTKAASRAMIKQELFQGSEDRGWIVNMASIYGLLGLPDGSAYCASKHAVLGITKSAALACAPYAVHVNAICPGYTATHMISAMWESNPDLKTALENAHPFGGHEGKGRLGRPEDIARVAVVLASEDAGWMTGSHIVSDGGFSIQ